MQDLVRLYAALANNGELRPLRYTNCKPDISNSTALIGRVFGGAREKIETEIVRKRVLSPEAAFLVLNILGHVPRPELNCADGDNSAPVFWKTGTSHGFRDAWSIGVFDHYVLAVWIGNFDGRPNGSFVGGTAAAPLFFQIIDSLRANWPVPDKPLAIPPNLKRTKFCSVSGDLPGTHCTDLVEGWFIPGGITDQDLYRASLGAGRCRHGFAIISRRRHPGSSPRGLRILAGQLTLTFSACGCSATPATTILARNTGRVCCSLRKSSAYHFPIA